MKLILQKAWALKFLQVSILVVENSVNIFFMTYNPFTRNYDSEYLNNQTKIFPEKLNNLEGYNLTIPVGTRSKAFFQTNKKKEKVVKEGGVYYPYVDIILERLNFCTKFELYRDPTRTEFVSHVLRDLEDNKIIISPIALFVNSHLYQRNLTIGNMFERTGLSVVVPIVTIKQVNISTTTMLIHVSSFVAIILVFVCTTVGCFKFKSLKWAVLYIYQILIGLPASQPKSNAERIIFILLSSLSVIYSSTFFSLLADTNFKIAQKNYDTISDLIKSKMIVYSRYSATKYDTADVQKLFSVKVDINFEEDCVKTLRKNRTGICIIARDSAEYYVEKHLDSKQQPIMKNKKFVGLGQFVAFAYEKASPFAEKFDRLIQLTLESGLLKYFKAKRKVVVHSSEKPIQVSEGNVIGNLVIVVGFSVAGMVFLGELFIFKLKSFFKGGLGFKP